MHLLWQPSWLSLLYGAIAEMLSLARTRYDANVRAAAAGMIGGIGRAGGVISPIVTAAELMRDGFLQTTTLSSLFRWLWMSWHCSSVCVATRRASRTDELVASA